MGDLAEMSDSLRKSPSAIPASTRLRTIVCEATQKRSVNFFRQNLGAIILTGSMARDEASFVRKADCWELYGDAEFVMVLKNGTSVPTKANLASLRQQIEDDLRRGRIHCSVDLSAVHPVYLRRLPFHIFSYELKRCGQVIWGDGRVLELIPDFSVDELSLEDAWRLLCNRLIEQLGLLGDLPTSGTELNARLFYASIKLFLDMATSYLVFARAYEPTYRARAARLRVLAKEIARCAAAPFPLVDFAQRVEKCTEWKFSLAETQSERQFEFWTEALTFARQLWCWEAIQLTHGSEAHPVRALFDQLSNQLTFIQKTRGWISVAKRNGGLKSWRHWPRWARLAAQITPRYLIYRIGIELIFQLPSMFGGSEDGRGVIGDLQELLHSLPLRTTPGLAARKDWQILADAVFQNYRCYLTTTVS